MLTQKHNVYAIPGWGFQASIFSALNNDKFNFVGLDYIHLSERPQVEIAAHLSKSLPDQVTLLGWSFGGLIAIQLASLFPNKVKKLILLASQPRLRSTTGWIGIEQDNAHDFQMALMNDFNKQMAYFIRLACYPSRSPSIRHILKQYLFRERIQELTSLLGILFDLDLRADYQGLEIDILQITSKQDAVIPQSVTQLKALNARVRTISLDHSGHAEFLTNPSATINAIEDFLEND